MTTSETADDDGVVCPFCEGDVFITREGDTPVGLLHSSPPCKTFLENEPHIYMRKVNESLAALRGMTYEEAKAKYDE